MSKASNAYYRDCKKKGICPRCGKNPASDGKVGCTPCREKGVAATKAIYEKRKAAGECGLCGAKADCGFSLCKACRDRGARYQIKYNRADPERCSARNKKYREDLRAKVLAAYGGKCACCGESWPEFLVVDHIRGGGCAHRKELRTRGIRSGSGFYRHLKKLGFPKDRFQLLCHNCNMSSAFYGECPHKTRPVRNGADH